MYPNSVFVPFERRVYQHNPLSTLRWRTQFSYGVKKKRERKLSEKLGKKDREIKRKTGRGGRHNKCVNTFHQTNVVSKRDSPCADFSLAFDMNFPTSLSPVGRSRNVFSFSGFQQETTRRALKSTGDVGLRWGRSQTRKLCGLSAIKYR